MAYDVQRFNELTKQMSAYAHYTRDGHLQLRRGARPAARPRPPARRAAQQPAAAAVPHRRRRPGRPAAARLRAARLRLPGPPGRRQSDLREPPSGQSGSSSATSGCEPASTRATRTAATAPPAPTPSGGASPTPPGRVDGVISRAPELHTRAACPSVSSARSTLTSSSTSNSPERVSELGGVVKQARPRVRLAWEAVQHPLRDPRRPPGRQAHVRDGRRAGEIGQVGRDQRDRAALQHAAEDHHVAARVLDRRRAPLRPLVRAHHQTVQLEPHRSQSSPPAATRRGGNGLVTASPTSPGSLLGR